MRSALMIISLLTVTVVSYSQEWSDKAHYEAYMKGDWKEVLRLGKEAKKAGADYYYIRARNGYSGFMLGKYFKAQKEFEKALKFNSSDAFAKHYAYWSAVYAGNTETALVMSEKMSDSQKDTIGVIAPKWLSGISLFGCYRISTSNNFSLGPGNVVEVTPPSDMPYVGLFLRHQFGTRVSFNHAISYVDQTRPHLIQNDGEKVWQIGYQAQMPIQVAKHTTVAPAFIMQYWETEDFSVYDLSGSVAVKQRFGNTSITAFGGYFEDTDTAKYIASGSFTWYPLSDLRLYTVTTGGYNFGGSAPNPFFRQTIGGNPIGKLWLSSSFVWNNQLVMQEDLSLTFANNSIDRLKWMWSLTPSVRFSEKFSVSLTYSAESRQLFIEEQVNPLPIGPQTSEAATFNYNFHSIYIGLHYNL